MLSCSSFYRLPVAQLMLLCVIATSGLYGLGEGIVASRPASAQSQSANSSVRQGYELLERGWVDDAIALFERSLQQSPDNLDAQLGLATAYRRAGRDADAVAAYQRTLALDPSQRPALEALGQLGEYRPEWQWIGIDALSRLLELDPNSLAARAQRAKLYYYQGLFSQSLTDYERVLDRLATPEHLGPAAEAYTFSGDPTTGLALFERYQTAGGKIDGNRAIAYAQALRKSGQVKRAVDILETEFQQHPELTAEQIRLRGPLASAYAAQRQFQQALELLQPLQGRSDSRLILARALNAIADASQQSDLRQEAASLYQAVLNSSENLTPGIRREASFVLSNLPTYQPAALDLVQQLQQEYPADASLDFQEQVLAYQTQRFSTAEFVQSMQQSFEQLPSDPVQLRYISQVLGGLNPPLVELMPLYQNLMATGEADAFLQLRMAQIWVQQRQLDKAKEALAAYAQSPLGQQDSATTELLLADIERREGNFEQSVQRYRAIAAEAPSLAIRAAALQGLAAVYQQQGQLEDAIALYDQLIAENPDIYAYQLARAAVAYRTGVIDENQANQILIQGYQRYSDGQMPLELFTLAAVLPPNPNRADLYQNLLAIEPTNPGLQLRALQVMAEQDPEQAKLKVAELIAANPEALDFYFVQGEIAQQVNDYALAQQSYDSVLQRDPDNLDALLAKAGLAFQQGNYDRADELYSRALSLNADSVVAQSSMASLNVVQGRPLTALSQLEQLQQQPDSDPDIARRMQLIREGLLQQRGIQPAWERF